MGISNFNDLFYFFKLYVCMYVHTYVRMYVCTMYICKHVCKYIGVYKCLWSPQSAPRCWSYREFVSYLMWVLCKSSIRSSLLSRLNNSCPTSFKQCQVSETMEREHGILTASENTACSQTDLSLDLAVDCLEITMYPLCCPTVYSACLSLTCL